MINSKWRQVKKSIKIIGTETPLSYKIVLNMETQFQVSSHHFIYIVTYIPHAFHKISDQSIK